MRDNMTAEELCRRFDMQPHPENGAFSERHYEHAGGNRPASGSIYYYVAPDERTDFHRIDCDEYWCYNGGSPLDIWVIAPDGSVGVRRLGIEDGCEPFVYLPQGVIFASRHDEAVTEGTFLTCITVPRFQYEGFELFEKEEILAEYPQTGAFFED